MPQLDGKQLKDGTVSTAKIAANAIDSTKVASSVLIASGANPLTGDLSAGSHKVTNLAAPTAANDAARLADVQAAQQGMTVKAAVKTATTGVLPSNTFAAGAPDTITSTTNNAFPAMDGITLALNDRLLVKDEATGSRNGIYTLTTVGTGATPWVLSRAIDYDATADIHEGDLMLVEEGTANGGSQFYQTAVAPVLNTTALVFTRFTTVVSFAAPTAAVDAAVSTAGSATTAIRSDAKLQVSTAAPSVTIKSEVTAAATGTATSVLRTDAQIQAATAAPTNLGTSLAQGTSSSLARADHVHAAAKATPSDKNLTASVTSADNQQATASTVTAAPVVGCEVAVFVNGLKTKLGNGTKTAVECYFSTDGVAARAWGSIVAGDKLWWNGSVAGYQLAATDVLDFVYDTF